MTLASAALLLATLACQSSTTRPVRETYVDRVEARVVLAREEPTHILRHNPAVACGCPPFEVKLGEHWQRVELGGELDDPVIVELLEAAGVDDVLGPRGGPAVLGIARVERERDRREFEIEGSLSDEIALCGRGGLYVSLVPTAFVGVVGESTPAPPVL